jgi:hypothetical protein
MQEHVPTTAVSMVTAAVITLVSVMIYGLESVAMRPYASYQMAV